SSRRRHTRSDRDWSSDVCSSDLEGWLNAKAFAIHPYVNPVERQSLLTLGEPAYNDLAFKRFEDGLVASPFAYLASCLRRSMYLRSEERRVGKECRFGGCVDDRKK